MKLFGAILVPPAAVGLGVLSAIFIPGIWGGVFWLVLLCACFSFWIYATWG